ncbi:MAG: prepilin-type N-terminal cleavage/methylation domain-containing protein [Candidatus Omnitrophica bacterium]|nr:prepilin-type N-terminal cleavage/methylation domain-containing protein [Candidatus Omnitrophota bacterium]
MTIKADKGFTLIEIMIVIAVLGVIMSIAIPGFIRTNEKAKRNSCVTNLKRIDEAKSLWAMDSSTDLETPVTMADLAPVYLKNTPACPSGGVYTVGDMRTLPTCTISGHIIGNE